VITRNLKLRVGIHLALTARPSLGAFYSVRSL